MGPESRKNNRRYIARNIKKASAKISKRLNYDLKTKQKQTKQLRKKLQAKIITEPQPVLAPVSMKFGSFNVNGLDLEGSWAIEEILRMRGFDVRC